MHVEKIFKNLIEKKGKKDEVKEVEEEHVKPTRPISSYIFYSGEMIPKLKKDEGITHREAMSKAGELWHTLSEDVKAKYVKMNEDDIKR